jgi:serine/threonine protein kinase
MPITQARFWLGEVVSGLEHMHLHGFVHRDMKVRSNGSILTALFQRLRAPRHEGTSFYY